MKALTLAFSILAVASISLQAQDTRTIGPFDELIVRGKIEVLLEQAATEQIIIETEGGDEDNLNISLQGSTLKLSMVDRWIYGDDRVLVRVQYKDLKDIRVSAGALLSSREEMNTDELVIKVHSGAELELDIAVKDLDVVVAEGGQLELSGSADKQRAVANTGGEYDGLRLDSDEVEVRANTGGEAKVKANQRLDATANTGGRIRYSGDPNEKYTQSNLAGDIRSY